MVGDVLMPEVAAGASWRRSPQVVKFWRSKEHARRMMLMSRAIARASAKNAPVMSGLERDAALSSNRNLSLLASSPTAEEVAEWLLTPGQAAAIEAMQRVAGEIKRLADSINQQNMVYGLGLELLQMSELSSYLMELDVKLKRARFAARRLGVNPVMDDFKREVGNGKQNTNRRAA